ncbi:alpha/beta hydrolase [Amylolactobacillus amylophilus]|uniref:Dienelactone hydrolase domain-containing protein n=1 Tax=Amylolactobacillus amylophilus DSM 20533 = JCM 1125 TaxID=1423721 RepID=A0A0R1YKZ2_9LACO|nr:alpha/beta hydrolase [Amylolactobacillus amylophilus]KRM43152.1 hypothetical protein FD40_GL000160 [Amylolactobacillus amylophilus DSM 20533 = JCM 1125]
MAEITANYFFEKCEDNGHPILMLHGTGGNEKDLVPIARLINAKATLIGIRGRLVENGQTRYFNHTASGGFDLESLSSETDWLLEQVDLLAKEHGFDVTKLTVIGYSNGANVAIYSMLEKYVQFRNAILFHPMALKESPKIPRLPENKVWLSHGDRDPIVSADNFEFLVGEINAAGMDYTIFNHQQSHNINRDEMVAAKQWYDEHIL